MNLNFTYPTEGLGYMAPILMIIALVAMPVVGVFGGWKRAAYWGGGNFVFYIIGMLIWRFAGYNIAGLLNPMIAKLIAGTGASADFTPLANSIIAPLFFIGFLLLANIILIINYFTWFRNVSGIRKVVKKKGKDGKVTKQIVKDFDNKSKGYKVMSHIVGGFGLLALTVPSIMSFTRASLFLTTSINTRTNNEFVSKFYDGFNNTAKKFDWLSYYSNEDSASDYDAVFCALYLCTTKMNFTNTWEAEPVTENMMIMKALGITLDQGLGGIFASTTNKMPDQPTPDDYKVKIDDICENVDKLALAWNSVLNADKGRSRVNIGTIFSSENTSSIVKQLIGIRAGNIKVSKDDIKNYNDDSFFAWMVKLFQDHKIVVPTPVGDITVEYDFEDFAQLDVNQKCYDNIKEALVKSYDLSELSTDEQKLFNNRMDELLNILFV